MKCHVTSKHKSAIIALKQEKSIALDNSIQLELPVQRGKIKHILTLLSRPQNVFHQFQHLSVTSSALKALIHSLSKPTPPSPPSGPPGWWRLAGGTLLLPGSQVTCRPRPSSGLLSTGAAWRARCQAGRWTRSSGRTAPGWRRRWGEHYSQLFRTEVEHFF